MKIPMEDWLRGCVYHDGRHGNVTLPTDKVLEIANYIQLTRTSQTEGCIELPPYTADSPQTETHDKRTITHECVKDTHDKTEPQTDDFFREPTVEERKAVAEYIASISIPTGVNVFDLMDEPQTERSE